MATSFPDKTFWFLERNTPLARYDTHAAVPYAIAYPPKKRGVYSFISRSLFSPPYSYNPFCIRSKLRYGNGTNLESGFFQTRDFLGCPQHPVPYPILCESTQGERVKQDDKHSNISLGSFGTSAWRLPGNSNGDFSKALSTLLPYVVVATAIAALIKPSTFTWVSKDYYAPALGGIMLSIGIQLSVKDFNLVLTRPMPVFVGYIAQYVFKPLLGLIVVKAFDVPAAFASGFLLTASVAGAQLASYASYLSGGDIALSIILTSLSTVSSVVITPLLTWLLIGSVVPVNGIAIAKSILQIVLCPVMFGLILNTYAKRVVDVIRPIMPLTAMICTSMCIGSPLAFNRAQVLSLEGLQLLIPVIVFHLAAFASGFWVAILPALSFDEKSIKTLSLCTGMQSSTLAGLLAVQFLGGTQAVPAACSVVVMAVLGLSLASFWGNGNSFSAVIKRFTDRLSSLVSLTDGTVDLSTSDSCKGAF
ncbi:hypothetical protein KP509_25G011800 [Ceratopteris richardii]|uniref:Sodium/metabolite cotransporter BASS3, chloroplastic n=2 Tax=Ceratopteris richardii TaxID=49495 RepID=A0A8T2RMP1_CERRI|nr:hypothetical protein KP509_25G011800 [Ceratopteris richardii]